MQAGSKSGLSGQLEVEPSELERRKRIVRHNSEVRTGMVRGEIMPMDW
jgi:hypothetical protein